MGMRFENPRLIDDHAPHNAYRAEVAPPVRSGRIPRWLAARVRKVDTPPFNYGRYSGWERDALAEHGNGILDHWGASKSCCGDREALVSEPYPLGLASLRKLVAFCDRYKLEVRVYAASWHYPTACVRLEFLPDDDPPGTRPHVVPLPHGLNEPGEEDA